ncbi:hypothetical protein BT63DRAFT_25585 [Microthyrium microscopicum]|uniref:Uncharacterized protein n=1 Tax=Microthyrium microscopicum TaxID=703497 RepID=A0A6A6UVI1_9PEZI|nr:hypothetical protein BT63DRAFT_25585 [Microthyrium microscopicum]
MEVPEYRPSLHPVTTAMLLPSPPTTPPPPTGIVTPPFLHSMWPELHQSGQPMMMTHTGLIVPVHTPSPPPQQVLEQTSHTWFQSTQPAYLATPPSSVQSPVLAVGRLPSDLPPLDYKSPEKKGQKKRQTASADPAPPSKRRCPSTRAKLEWEVLKVVEILKKLRKSQKAQKKVKVHRFGDYDLVWWNNEIAKSHERCKKVDVADNLGGGEIVVDEIDVSCAGQHMEVDDGQAHNDGHAMDVDGADEDEAEEDEMDYEPAKDLLKEQMPNEENHSNSTIMTVPAYSFGDVNMDIPEYSFGDVDMDSEQPQQSVQFTASTSFSGFAPAYNAPIQATGPIATVPAFGQSTFGQTFPGQVTGGQSASSQSPFKTPGLPASEYKKLSNQSNLAMSLASSKWSTPLSSASNSSISQAAQAPPSRTSNPPYQPASFMQNQTLQLGYAGSPPGSFGLGARAPAAAPLSAPATTISQQSPALPTSGLGKIFMRSKAPGSFGTGDSPDPASQPRQRQDRAPSPEEAPKNYRLRY